MSGKAVKKQETGEIVSIDAELFEQDAGQGLGELGAEDVSLPFIKIVQSQSKEIIKRGARPGDIYNNATMQHFDGTGGVRIIPCSYNRRFIEWSPLGASENYPLNIFAPTDNLPETQRNDDNKDQIVGSQNYLEDTRNHYVLLIDEDGMAQPGLMALTSSQMKKSKKWNSMISSRYMDGKNGKFLAPSYSHIYRAKIVEEGNAKGDWYGWELSVEGVVEDVGLYQQAKAFAEAVASDAVTVKHSRDDAGAMDGDVMGDDAPF
tara:strand:- start:3686 stop:4471 length:786 start_codon:yes stop_codon:yes gene_type:complete